MLTFVINKDLTHSSEASNCAGEKEKYWEMHDLIFENQQKMSVPNLIEHAESLGLDGEEFKVCTEEGKHAEGVKKDIEAGRSSGVSGTPSFLLGKVNGKDEVEGMLIRGAKPYKVFSQAIEAMLRKIEEIEN